MAKLFNRAKMTTSTTGSGTVTLGSASVGYQSFADAGVADGDVVQYVIEEGSNFEIGTGTYSATGTSLTRSPTESSNSGSAITLAGAAKVSITAVADDLNRLQHAGSTKVEPTSTGATVTGNLAVTGTVDGRDVAADGTKLDGIETGATADQTAAEIRSLVESATDSNVFTDADHTKLNGIESGATADQTASEILTAIKTVDGAGSGLDADTLDGSHASAFLTGNQTITLTGDATGSGTTSISVSLSADSVGASEISANAVGASELNVTGNGTTSQFLRSDGDGTFTWATPTDTNTVPNNATITLTAGTGLSGGGNFTTDQSTNETITFNLSAPYTYIDTATGQYGTVKVDDDRGVTWAGYAIRDDWVFMSNGAAEAGIYNDTDNDWAIRFAQNGTTSLQYNGSTRFQTESAGASAPAGLRVGNSGNPHNADALEINTATDEHIVLSGSTNPYIRWQEGTTDRAYIQYNATNNALTFKNQEADYFDFFSHDSTGAINLRLKGSDGDTWGSLYADDNGDAAGRIGFLDDDQSWAYRITSDATHEWLINGTAEMSLSTTTLDLKDNTITNVEDIYLNDRIYHDGDTDTYMQFHAANQWRVVCAGAEQIEVGNGYVLLNDNKELRFGTGSDFRIDFNGSNTVFRNYAHAGGDFFFQGEGSDGNNRNALRCDFSGANAYVALYDNSAEVLTTNGGVAVTGGFTATGDVTAYYSDSRLKTKTGDIENALDKVKQLNGFYYVENDKAKEFGFENDKTQVALSAQEVQAVMPEAVSLAPFDLEKLEDGTVKSKSGEDYLTVNYARLVPLLVEAMKEQQQQIDDLKAMLGDK